MSGVVCSLAQVPSAKVSSLVPVMALPFEFQQGPQGAPAWGSAVLPSTPLFGAPSGTLNGTLTVPRTPKAGGARDAAASNKDVAPFCFNPNRVVVDLPYELLPAVSHVLMIP